MNSGTNIDDPQNKAMKLRRFSGNPDCMLSFAKGSDVLEAFGSEIKYSANRYQRAAVREHGRAISPGPNPTNSLNTQPVSVQTIEQRVLKRGESVSLDRIDVKSGVRTPVEEAQIVMPFFQRSPHRWAVLLAGGDGTRLQSLTLKIAGDSRPKQFCSIIGGESLLAQTRARLESLIHVDRELFIVTRAHEIYYRQELRDVDDSRIISQPLNRGTGVAVAVALLHILQRDPDAVVIFVPCDHYYSDAQACGQAIRSAIFGAEQYPDSVILVGAKAHYPEVEYGWIELGSAISHTPVPLLQVKQFWEKPSFSQAEALLHSGCFWNTFLTVGRASTFLDLICSQVPDVVLSLNKALAKNELEAAYPLIPTVDLSRQVLTPQPHRLLTVPDMTSGWTDLGSPTRVMEILARNKIQPAWLRDGHGLSKTAGSPNSINRGAP